MHRLCLFLLIVVFIISCPLSGIASSLFISCGVPGATVLVDSRETAATDSNGEVYIDDVIPGTLSLEVWTSKGDRNLLFRQNEETEIFIRVNKPCYLQVLYHMANGVRLVLYNNLYIDISKVNQVFTLPDTFYFAPPLGVERLQVFAGTEKFDDVNKKTVVFEGETYDTVLAEDYKEHTVMMRGIKKKDINKELVEKILTLTTITQ